MLLFFQGTIGKTYCFAWPICFTTSQLRRKKLALSRQRNSFVAWRKKTRFLTTICSRMHMNFWTIYWIRLLISFKVDLKLSNSLLSLNLSKSFLNLEEKKIPKASKSATVSPVDNQPPQDGFDAPTSSTWVHEIFQGTLTNETRCLNCESVRKNLFFVLNSISNVIFCVSLKVSSKDEDFLDLSVDVDQNTSITHCLRVFSNTETLCCEHKYYCDNCCSKQEAQKR